MPKKNTFKKNSSIEEGNKKEWIRQTYGFLKNDAIKWKTGGSKTPETDENNIGECEFVEDEDEAIDYPLTNREQITLSEYRLTRLWCVHQLMHASHCVLSLQEAVIERIQRKILYIKQVSLVKVGDG